MRKVKKWCALLMASVMLAGTLTGCAVDEKTQENGSEQAGDEGKATKAARLQRARRKQRSR